MRIKQTFVALLLGSVASKGLSTSDEDRNLLRNSRNDKSDVAREDVLAALLELDRELQSIPERPTKAPRPTGPEPTRKPKPPKTERPSRKPKPPSTQRPVARPSLPPIPRPIERPTKPP